MKPDMHVCVCHHCGWQAEFVTIQTKTTRDENVPTMGPVMNYCGTVRVAELPTCQFSPVLPISLSVDTNWSIFSAPIRVGLKLEHFLCGFIFGFISNIFVEVCTRRACLSGRQWGQLGVVTHARHLPNNLPKSLKIFRPAIEYHIMIMHNVTPTQEG